MGINQANIKVTNREHGGEFETSMRTRSIILWILNNQELIDRSNAVKIKIHVKGDMAVAGEVTILPDSKI